MTQYEKAPSFEIYFNALPGFQPGMTPQYLFILVAKLTKAVELSEKPN